jgi:hypothetical protein
MMFVRTMIPAAMLALWVCSVGIFVVVLQIGDSGAASVGVLGALVGLINVLVVKNTGRPAWQVPATFRRMTEAELEEWFGGDDAGVRAR